MSFLREGDYARSASDEAASNELVSDMLGDVDPVMLDFALQFKLCRRWSSYPPRIKEPKLMKAHLIWWESEMWHRLRRYEAGDPLGQGIRPIAKKEKKVLVIKNRSGRRGGKGRRVPEKVFLPREVEVPAAPEPRREPVLRVKVVRPEQIIPNGYRVALVYNPPSDSPHGWDFEYEQEAKKKYVPPQPPTTPA